MNPSYELMDRAREEYARKGVLRQEFHKGFEAGKRARTPEQWQLDMKRMEVARRVDAVTLDKGSHGNLSTIASAIYEPRFGWTSGACAMLRDTLVRLLGGAHERDCRGGRDDTGAPCADNSDGEQAEEVNLLGGDEPTLSDLWGVWKDDDWTRPNDDGTCPNDGPTSSITDERHKAVCELRKIHADAGGFVKALANALGVEWQAPRAHQTLAKVRDRLIYLLGGNEPNFTETAETIKSGDECEVELMENGENHKMATITDELRAYSRDSVNRDDYMGGLTFDLDRIADRIDEQFDRICEQHERVLQSTIDEMCDELSGLEENNAELTAKCEALMAANAGLAKGIDDARESEYRAERQRDELRDKFAEYDLQSRLEEQGDITMTHREMRRMLGEVKHLHDTLRARSNAMSQVTKERDELRRTCAELRRELEGGQHG